MALLDRIAAAPEGIPVDDLPQEPNRATTLRRLRVLAAEGRIGMEWRLRPTSVAPRMERRVALTPAGVAVLGQLADGERPPG